MATDSRIGTEIAGYRIERVLGRGGMGVVYVARHLRLDRTVALKVVSPDLAEDPKFRDRFVRESQLAASLEHPNIVPIHDAGEEGGVLYLAMRLVSGTDLKRLIEGSDGGLDPARALKLLDQVAGALDSAHQAGLVHRDVKPGNVLIGSPETASEHAYLSDFGLTKRLTSDSGLTGTGQFVGTLDYAAPEQFEGKALDGRADVYSLACVAYECLTGEIPYRRDNQAALVYAHLMAEPPKVTEARPELPDAINPVVAKGMVKKPEDRYPTAGELIGAARAALEPERPTVVLGQLSTAEASAARLRRRIVAAVALAGVVVIGIVIGVMLGSGGKGPAPPPSGLPTAAGLAASDRVDRIASASSNQGLARITPVKTGKDPRAVTVSDGSIWVANAEGTVSRIEPATNKSLSITVGKDPEAIAAGEGGIWVVNRLTRSVSHIDPGTNKVIATIELEVTGFPSTITVGEGAVWVGVEADFPLGSHAAAVHKIDPTSNRDVATIPLQGRNGWIVMTAGDGFVWAAGEGGRLFRIDPRTNEVKPLGNLSDTPAGIVLSQGSLWVAVIVPKVLRIDPATGRVEATVPGGGSPPTARAQPGGQGGYLVPISAVGGIVFVAGQINGTLDRIDANGNTPLTPIQIGQVPTGVAFGYDAVWVTVDAKG